MSDIATDELRVAELRSSCIILLESQHKVSAAVEKNLQAHGVNVEARSAGTRSRSSMRSVVIGSQRSETPAPQPDSASSAGTGHDEPATEEAAEPEVGEDPGTRADDLSANTGSSTEPSTEARPETAEIQEAGLTRIENLLAAVIARLDESTQAQTVPEPLPETTADPPEEPSTPEEPERQPAEFQPPTRPQTIADTLSEMEDLYTVSDARSVIDLDADVALWKIREKGYPLSQIESLMASPPAPPISIARQSAQLTAEPDPPAPDPSAHDPPAEPSPPSPPPPSLPRSALSLNKPLPMVQVRASAVTAVR